MTRGTRVILGVVVLQATNISGFAGILEPSDGLEPSTPPYHSALKREARATAGTRGHEKSRKRNELPDDE
jgi:hypothetical protein